jgi:hypothetical protein
MMNNFWNYVDKRDMPEQLIKPILPSNLWTNIIMWRIHLLLCNDSVYTFPQESTRSTIGRLLLSNGTVNTPKTVRGNRRRCCKWGPPQGYTMRSSKGAVSCQKLREFSWRIIHLSQLLSRMGSSSGDGSRRWLRRNDKKEIRLWKQDFMCDLKWE